MKPSSGHLVFVSLQTIALSWLVARAEQIAGPTGGGSAINSALSLKELDRAQPQVSLEARASASDQSFIKDIVDRLHSLDADIGRLLFNSSSMYAPTDQAIAQNQPKGGEKFTEVLSDLDSLQDEIGGLVSNATRSRQYNMVVRLRPLNSILYRIRHNLQLMRNSLVAINTVSSLEKLGNSVLDSTLQAFMRPDANLNEEIGDDGNYDFNLDKPEPGAAGASPNTSSLPAAQPQAQAQVQPQVQAQSGLRSTPAASSTSAAQPSTTTTTSTTTTSSPRSSSTSTPLPTTSASSSTSAATRSVTSRRTTQRSQTRRPNSSQRNNRRSSTQKPASSTTSQATSTSAHS